VPGQPRAEQLHLGSRVGLYRGQGGLLDRCSHLGRGADRRFGVLMRPG
jgi:hypothetical protein